MWLDGLIKWLLCEGLIDFWYYLVSNEIVLMLYKVENDLLLKMFLLFVNNIDEVFLLLLGNDNIFIINKIRFFEFLNSMYFVSLIDIIDVIL